LVNVIAKLSDIYDVSIEEVATITTQNSKDVFGI
jgi:TatD DNase family protein